MYQWPDLTLPPINLWNVPKQSIWSAGHTVKQVGGEKPAVRQTKTELLQQLLRTR